MAFVFTLVALIFCVQSAQAATKTWDAGSTDGDWSFDHNWNNNSVPGSGDDILFDNTGQSPLENAFLNGARTINSLTLNLTVGSNQTWNLGADDSTSAFTFTLGTGNISVLSTSGTGTYVIGAASGTLIGTGIMTLATSAAGFTFDNSRTNGGLLQIDAIVSGSSKTLTKTGAGTITLSGANTYTGATTVSAGILKAGVASVANTSGAFGNNSAVMVADVSGATLDITGFNTQIGSLTGGGATGGNVILGAATLTTGGDNTSPAAYAGVISGTGGGNVIVNNAGTLLGGSGTITGSVTVNSGATIAPGATANSTAILSTGAVTLQGATLALNVNGTIAGTLYDQLNISGAITITGGTLALNFGTFTPAPADRFFIALNDGSDAVTGTFGTITGLPSGFAVVYDADSGGGFAGNDIAILGPVPEPSTWCAAALAAAMIGFQLRFRLRAASSEFISRLTVNRHRFSLGPSRDRLPTDV